MTARSEDVEAPGTRREASTAGEAANLQEGASPATYDKPGYYSMPMATYLADPCPEPALSTGVVRALSEQSPAHALVVHPRFQGDGSADDPTPRSDIGQAVHSLALGGAKIEYVESATLRSGPRKGETFVPTDWKSKDAQDASDLIRARGHIPLLLHQKTAVEAAAESVLRVLEKYGPIKTEQTMLWQDGGVWCRGRSDVLTDDGNFDIDIKTTENAEPGAWIASTLFAGGYDIQAALRLRGHELLGGRTRDFYCLLVEIVPPYACSLVRLHEETRQSADEEITRAIELWRRCVSTRKWPAYSLEPVDAMPSSRVLWAREARRA